MTVQSVQVDIVHAGARVDTTMPSPLQNRIPASEWDRFCTELQMIIDEAMPAASLRLIPCAVVFLIGLVLFVRGIMRQPQDPSFDDGLPTSIIVGVILMPIAAFCACPASASQSRKQQEKVVDLCKSMWDELKHANISFHVRQGVHGNHDGPSSTRSYVEIIFVDSTPILQSNSGQGQIPSAQATVLQGIGDIETATATATPQTTGSSAASPSLAERLSNLDSIKDVLSAEEYKSKRKEILDSV